MSTVPERLEKLRALMAQRGIDAYLVPTDDFHGSEYVGTFFRCRKYITGFTGSAGTAVICQDQAGLWTDGRYFIQAASQLAGSGITLYKSGNEGVPTIDEYLERTLQEGMTLGFDGRCVSASWGRRLQELLAKKKGAIRSDVDLVGEIWEDRPALSHRPIWELPETYTGKTRGEKLADVRAAMKQAGCDRFVLTSLDDIAWLLNLRGDDVSCNPVFLSYLEVTAKDAALYVQDACLADGSGEKTVFPAGSTIQGFAPLAGSALRAQLLREGIAIRSYDQIYEAVRAIPSGETLWMDGSNVNYALSASVPEGVIWHDASNPTILPKALKNAVEIEGMRQAHIKDGVAMVKFLYWLKHAVPEGTVTECSAGRQLEVFRGAQEHYLGPSFDPIVGYGEHGAIVHYSSSPETDVVLKPEGTVLIDCGGQYLEGTTDITRTIVLGPVSEKQRAYSTRVLRGNLQLAAAKFLEGTSGSGLDVIARRPLWEVGADYNHGTGHGVGSLLNVHEGPQRIHWRNERGAEKPILEGMVTSDEPGFYLEGEFGIRHENLMVCKTWKKIETGQFLEFETLTLVPIDIEGINPEEMTREERSLLNAYHKKVYDTISPYLEEEEKIWLRQATRSV